jgi:hypothetical protein
MTARLIALRFRILAGLFLAIGLAAQAHAASEFQYSIPPGWRDLKLALSPANGNRDVNDIPQQLLVDTMSGRFAAVAVDPNGTTYQKAGATFNAIEANTTGRMTVEALNRAGADLISQLAAAGFTATLLEARVVKMNGVNVGMTTVDIETEKETRRLLQYLITGKKTMAVLSFAAPKADFDRYLPAFEASARATKGGYNYGSWDWERTFVAGGLGALIFGASAFVMGYVRKRRDAEAAVDAGDGGEPVAAAPARAAGASPLKKASKYTWTCPGCGNPVPSRLDQCRCGTGKPA